LAYRIDMPLFSRSKGVRGAERAEVPEPVVEPAPPPTPIRHLPGAPTPNGAGLREIDEHRDYLLSLVPQMRPFGIGLMDAGGLTLCETLTSDLDLPIYTAATVTGWAVRASNLVGASDLRPIIMPMAGEIRADGRRGVPLSPGTVVYIESGAPLPDGADAVVPLDRTAVAGREVEFREEATFQQNLWLAGSRVADGDRLLGTGARLTPRAIGLIAEVGHDKVLARPRPRVAIVTSADGLVEPGLPLTSLNQRYDSTTPLLAAAAREDGAQVFASPIVPRDPRQVANAVSEQLVRADLLLLIADLDADLLQAMSGLGSFDVAPVDGFAAPLVFGLIGPEGVPMVVLPVRPVPAYLAYELFARPLVERLAGQEISDPELLDGQLTAPLDADPTRTRLVLAHSTSAGVRPLPVVGDQGAAELSDANAVAFVPAGMGHLAAGSAVVCWMLD
jgi:molybdopterin molybdotransferase